MDSTLTLDPDNKALAKITKGCKPGDQIRLEGVFTVGQDMSLTLDSVEDYEKESGSDEAGENPEEEKSETPKEEADEESTEGNPDAPQGQEEKNEVQGTPTAAGGTTPTGKAKMHYPPALLIAIHDAHAMPGKKAA